MAGRPASAPLIVKLTVPDTRLPDRRPRLTLSIEWTALYLAGEVLQP